MKKFSTSWLPPFLAPILLLGLIINAGAQGITLEDFGHQKMKINGTLAVGARPTLVILLDLADTGSFAHSNSYYDNLVFNVFNTNSAGLRSVNGFMLVNSHARFSLARAGAGLIGPLKLPAAERTQALTNDTMRSGFTIQAAWTAGFNFAQFDSNGDGRITHDELLVLIFNNLTQDDSGAARWANPSGIHGADFTPPDSPVSFGIMVGLMTQRVSFATLCHEFTHVLGTRDLYGGLNGETVCYNYQYTLMSCTITRADDMVSFGLDAWHKLQLGWVDPRIRLLSTGGVETTAAAQSVAATDAPVILYDPARGSKEFFLVEYRTRNSPGGAGYEDDLPSNGLAIWHVVHDANNNLFQFANGIPSVRLYGPPDLQPGTGPNLLWNNNVTTPLLTWADGTATSTKINVKPFNSGDGSVAFEWFTPSETWVEFQYSGVEQGSFAQPFNTLAEAVNAASHGGIVRFKRSGSSAEALTISKRLDFQASGGAVTIGR